MTDTEVLREVLPRFVSIEQAARLAGCHEATIRRAVDAGQLAGVRSDAWGRMVHRASVEAWAAGRGAVAQAA